MKKISTVLSTMICSVFILLMTVETVLGSGTSISAVSRLDLSNGVVAGKSADYSLVLPAHWKGYLIADREQVGRDSRVLDKLTFYYQPFGKVSKPVYVMDLCVYNRNEYTDEGSYRKIMDTKMYSFSVRNATQNQLGSATDKAVFNLFLQDIQDDDFLIKMIKLSDGDERIVEHTITVNGQVLRGAVIQDQTVPYLPVREVSQVLGYKVGWLDKERAVTIAKGSDYYALLTINESSANMGYRVIMKDGVAYVSTIFFIQQLKCNVEVDGTYNVFIYK